ncbi:MAG: hypothetical protein ACSHYC_07000 [Alphaproteobacteria bacterium]
MSCEHSVNRLADWSHIFFSPVSPSTPHGNTCVEDHLIAGIQWQLQCVAKLGHHLTVRLGASCLSE